MKKNYAEAQTPSRVADFNHTSTRPHPGRGSFGVRERGVGRRDVFLEKVEEEEEGGGSFICGVGREEFTDAKR